MTKTTAQPPDALVMIGDLNAAGYYVVCRPVDSDGEACVALHTELPALGLPAAVCFYAPLIGDALAQAWEMTQR